jgi:hypothetical protein
MTLKGVFAKLFGRRTQQPSFPLYEPKVQALWIRAQELTDGERHPTIGELLDLRREIQNVKEDTSLLIAGRFSLFRLTDGIDGTLDKAMNQIPELKDSPEAQDLRRGRARYKEAFSPEFQKVMERCSEDGSAENTEAFGDVLFPTEHTARLVTILDYATGSERATYAELFEDWVRLKEYSPSEVAECVDAQVIQRLTSK